MYSTSITSTIKSWAEEDRPREKMCLKGERHLTDAELLAILLGSGSREESAVALAQRILNIANHNLHDLARIGIKELMKVKGVGEVKAITIMAALELGRRRQLSDLREKPQLRSSRDEGRAMSKEEAKTAEKTEAAAKEPKAPATKTYSGYPEMATITLLADKDGKVYGPDHNPKRPGSATHTRFALYKNGMTIKDAIAAGVQAGDLPHDIAHSFIAVSLPKE